MLNHVKALTFRCQMIVFDLQMGQGIAYQYARVNHGTVGWLQFAPLVASPTSSPRF